MRRSTDSLKFLNRMEKKIPFFPLQLYWDKIDVQHCTRLRCTMMIWYTYILWNDCQILLVNISIASHSTFFFFFNACVVRTFKIYFFLATFRYIIWSSFDICGGLILGLSIKTKIRGMHKSHSWLSVFKILHSWIHLPWVM